MQPSSRLCERSPVSRQKATPTQLGYLAEYMRNHNDMASGLGQSLQGRMALERGWATLAHELNSMGPPVKDISRWKQAWRDMKTNVKRKAAHNRAEYRGYGPESTGNGPPKLVELTSTENQVLEVLGPVAVFGMEEVAATEVTEEKAVKADQSPQPDQQPPLPGEQPPQPGVRKRKRQRSLPIGDNFDKKLLEIEEKKIKIEEERNAIFGRLVHVMQDISNKLDKLIEK